MRAAVVSVGLLMVLSIQPPQAAGEPDGADSPQGLALSATADDESATAAALDESAELADAETVDEVVAPVPTRFTPADTLAAIATASPRARCIVRTEVGGVGYDPYAIGRQGEKGATQLHPRGLLADFYAHGFDNPFNPYQEVAHLEGALRRGLATHWSGVKLGMC